MEAAETIEKEGALNSVEKLPILIFDKEKIVCS